MSTRRGAAANDGAAPSLSVEDPADAADDADVADGEKTKKKGKKPDDGPVPNPPLRVAAGIAAAGCVESSYLGGGPVYVECSCHNLHAIARKRLGFQPLNL
jgi:hypothetical protein